MQPFCLCHVSLLTDHYQLLSLPAEGNLAQRQIIIPSIPFHFSSRCTYCMLSS
uniref:Uncharacterized protein n=1 Tax=Arundo donax TaxID=35708 RepID=A0A0A8YWK8_ARUDO